jgi:molybdopterin-guanine dinucleotide biosynthesis protein A
VSERLAWTGIVLAGGRGRRFGDLDKCRLPLGGRSLLQRSLDVLLPVTATRVVVGGPPRCDVPTLDDAFPGDGPIGGVLTALGAITTTHALVIACDLPFLTAAFLRDVCEAGRDTTLGLVETRDGRVPLCLSVRRDARDAVTAYWNAGGRRVTDLRRLLAHAIVPPSRRDRHDPAERLLLNVNDPLTYARALAEAEHDCVASYFTDLDESKRNP